MKDKTKKGIGYVVALVLAGLCIANAGFQLHDNIENHKEVVEEDTTIEQVEEA